MSYKKLLTIQDVSCLGQCSLTVALPILSACGMETCIIPSAVLSTHTAGFNGYTFKDLTDEIPLIAEHWKREKIEFDAVYTGYLGSVRQIDYVKSIIKSLAAEHAKTFIDPAMADGGKLYPGFDMNFVAEMKKLCFSADFILPNITEACLLTGLEFKTEYDEEYINDLIEALRAGGAKTVVLTGVGYDPNTTGVVVADDEGVKYYRHRKIAQGCHGTGDVYSSAFVGAYLNGYSAYDSAKIAADFTVDCIEKTVGDASHWYGVKFEQALPELIKLLNK